MSDALLPAVAAAFRGELDAALGRITHCVNQLADEQVWAPPRADLNPVGTLLLHLTGNLQQYVVSGVGGEPDDRNRPAEFAAREPVPKAELLQRLTAVVERAKAVLAAATATDLARVRPVQNTDQTGIQAVVRSVAHFRGHAQEIIHITRTLLGDRYQFAGPR